MGAWGVVFLEIAIIFIIIRVAVQLTPRVNKYKTVIVMGSGGHTSEILRFLETIENINTRVWPRHYIIANTDRGDKGSEVKVLEFEKKIQMAAKWSDSRTKQNYYIHRIPRSREVGQSYITSVFTTIWSFLISFRLMWKISPDLVLANGPGTCVPVCLSAWLLKLIGITPHTFISLSESYACVSHLSLTTKMLYSIVNVVFVQWPKLALRYPKAIYSGRIVPNQPLKLKPKESGEKSYVFVTVGTTKFPELIRTVDTVEFGNLLRDLGYTGIHIQYGNDTPPKNIQKTSQFSCQIFDYKSDLKEEVNNCSLVIGHAGVGTIFEVLEKEKNLVVVPNTKLMNNHQMEISKEMADRRFLLQSTCETLKEDLKKANFSHLFLFPSKESNAWVNTLELKLRF
jgi:beta-1,4-N-acetylglucosaminyltransferase